MFVVVGVGGCMLVVGLGGGRLGVLGVEVGRGFECREGGLMVWGGRWRGCRLVGKDGGFGREYQLTLG